MTVRPAGEESVVEEVAVSQVMCSGCLRTRAVRVGHVLNGIGSDKHAGPET